MYYWYANPDLFFNIELCNPFFSYRAVFKFEIRAWYQRCDLHNSNLGTGQVFCLSSHLDLPFLEMSTLLSVAYDWSSLNVLTQPVAGSALPLSLCRICFSSTPGITFCTSKWSCVWRLSWTTLLQRSDTARASRTMTRSLLRRTLRPRWRQRNQAGPVTHRPPSIMPLWHM